MIYLLLILLYLFIPWVMSTGFGAFAEEPGWLFLIFYIAIMYTLPFAVISLVVNVVALGYLKRYSMLFKILGVVVLGAVVGFLFATTPFVLPEYSITVLALVPVQLYFFIRTFRKLDHVEE